MRKTALLCVVLGLMVSCSSEKKTSTEAPTQSSPKPAAKEAQYDTGRAAFQRMYLAARGWAGDVKPFRLQSQFTADAPTCRR